MQNCSVMEKAFVFCAFLTLSLGATALAVTEPSQDESYIRCEESCLKLNDNTTGHDFGSSQLVKHCAKLTPDGKCECDWEKVLTEAGKCVCRNPQHRINESNHCVCDPSKCDPPMKDCKDLGTITDDCCPKYSCSVDTCPEDSYRSNQTLDGSCLCYPCKAANCKANQKTIIIRKGTKTPGTCCDLYQCDDVQQNKTCEANGKSYANGETWLEGRCTLHRCENGIVFQEMQEGCKDDHPCFSNGKIYEHGQSWMEDECTNCTCDHGENKCMAHFCKDLPRATIRPKEEECPWLAVCRKKCAFGFRLNRRGCEICKCRQPDMKMLHDILRALNCTGGACDAVRMLPSNCSDGSNVSIEQCPKCTDAYCAFKSTVVVLVAVIVILVFLVGFFIFLWCKARKHKFCIFHPTSAELQPHNYARIAMFDANLNSEKPILCEKPTVELKDFR